MTETLTETETIKNIFYFNMSNKHFLYLLVIEITTKG
jgi:hypothetical protein